MAKYLDLEGLTTFWTKIKTWVSSAVTSNSPSTSKTVTGWNEGKITYGNIQIAESQVTNLTTDLGKKAPLASPALTGTPTAPTAATGTNSTQIATTAFVNAEIDAKMSEADAMVYKGTVAGGSTGAYGALTPAASKGWTYKVTTAGKINGVAVEVGDMLICNTDDTAAATANNYSTIAANWDVIQGNQDGVVIGPASATSGNVAIYDGATGKLIKDSGLTLGKSVPSDAVFTDTKVTAVGNHYTPAADTTAELSATASGATAAWSGDFVKGVQLQRDAKGHVTGVSVTSGKMPANPNTDTKVTQNSNAENKEFPLLAKFTNNTTNETNTAKYAAGVTVNPSTKKITATAFVGDLEGNASTASAAKAGSELETALNGKQASLSFDGTYNASSNKVATVSSITTRIQALDVASVGGDGKYISAISETDGKISATATDMDTEPTTSSNKAVTSGGIATAIESAQNTAERTAANLVAAEAQERENAINAVDKVLVVNQDSSPTMTDEKYDSITAAYSSGKVVELRYGVGGGVHIYEFTGISSAGMTFAKNDGTYSYQIKVAPTSGNHTVTQTTTQLKTVQDAVTGTGSTIQTLTSLKQDTNGKIEATFSNIRSASTSQTGVVQLSSATNSTSTTLAATASSVKSAYDRSASAVASFADTGAAGTTAKITYTTIGGTTADLMTAITNAEINELA